MSTTHYHILWSNSKVDWQFFRTEEEATTEAERLRRFDETYLIEPHKDGDCLRCNETRLNA